MNTSHLLLPATWSNFTPKVTIFYLDYLLKTNFKHFWTNSISGIRQSPQNRANKSTICSGTTFGVLIYFGMCMMFVEHVNLLLFNWILNILHRGCPEQHSTSLENAARTFFLLRCLRSLSLLSRFDWLVEKSILLKAILAFWSRSASRVAWLASPGN